MKEIYCFKPNTDTHKAFAEALKGAKVAGVKILAVDSIVTKDSIEIDQFVKTEI